MLQLKVSEATAARRRIPVKLVDATDGFTPETGVTVAAAEVQISKNGAAFANFGGTWAEVGGGLYYYEATTAELNTIGFVSVKIVKTGCRQFDAVAQVVSFDPYDAAALGLTISSRIPAALVGGRMDSSVGAVAASAITATSIATGAITSAKLAASAITATAIASNAITDAKIATGAITATKFATNAIDASALAADAVTEIVTGVFAFAHEAGRTVQGVMRRLDALMTGKATGLVGALATFYRADGVTKAMEATQDTTLGTRDIASTVGGD